MKASLKSSRTFPPNWFYLKSLKKSRQQSMYIMYCFWINVYVKYLGIKTCDKHVSFIYIQRCQHGPWREWTLVNWKNAFWYDKLLLALLSLYDTIASFVISMNIDIEYWIDNIAYSVCIELPHWKSMFFSKAFSNGTTKYKQST